MKLGTVRDGSRDGRLVVVNRDITRFVEADAAPTLQAALDQWDKVHAKLQDVYQRLNSGAIKGETFEARRFNAPLPRAYEWVDGSAYLNHVALVRKARGAELPATLRTDPLI